MTLVGGTGRDARQPSVILCTNAGWDGQGAGWTARADESPLREQWLTWGAR